MEYTGFKSEEEKGRTIRQLEQLETHRLLKQFPEKIFEVRKIQTKKEISFL